jgi:hypothetical protein
MTRHLASGPSRRGCTAGRLAGPLPPRMDRRERRVWIAESAVSVRPTCVLAAAAFPRPRPIQVRQADRPDLAGPGCNGAACRPARISSGPAESHSAHPGTVAPPIGGSINGQRPIHNRMTRTRGPGGAGSPTGSRIRTRTMRPGYLRASGCWTPKGQSSYARVLASQSLDPSPWASCFTCFPCILV